MAYKEKLDIVKPLIDILEGKNSGLNQKHLKILRFMGNILLPLIFNIICPALVLLISLKILITMYYAYNNFDVDYNPVIHFLWAIYYWFDISQMVYSIVLAFGLLTSFSLYIKLRFNQVNKLLKSNNIKIILTAIKKYRILCSQVEEINNLMSIHLTAPLLAVTFAWDIAFYLTLYGQSFTLRFVMAIITFLLLLGSLFSFFSGALFISEAHKPYEKINSLMVKKCLNYRSKWKVSWTCLILSMKYKLFKI